MFLPLWLKIFQMADRNAKKKHQNFFSLVVLNFGWSTTVATVNHLFFVIPVQTMANIKQRSFIPGVFSEEMPSLQQRDNHTEHEYPWKIRVQLLLLCWYGFKSQRLEFFKSNCLKGNKQHTNLSVSKCLLRSRTKRSIISWKKTWLLESCLY